MAFFPNNGLDMTYRQTDRQAMILQYLGYFSANIKNTLVQRHL